DFFKVNDYLFDGNSTFGVSGITTMVKADTKVASVSAASILAKVSRDRVMVEQSKIYPEYGFEKHKGYGTKAHIEAISQNGYTPIHRRSFKIKLHKME
ncbi:MAG TPA: ribonuclease HII, partial [Nitratifractor sp.]|nr:ribonuclease HII [Nitratifractor sp.]